MGLPNEPYFDLVVESFLPASTAGRRGRVHVRPVDGQGIDSSLFVECARAMTLDYPVGTRFRVRAKYSNRKGRGAFLIAPYAWGFSVLS